MGGWMRGLGLGLVLVACGGSRDDDDDDGIYESCVEADECSSPDGFDPVCLEKGDEGFCTATCGVDDDCVNPDFVPETP